ncbi:hypothetical protein CNBN0600 [Cryptococcus deneoformans B-3501A]|uniref:Uncharacterized protein n=1 Tax=Cryptococcus deneoformans (strain JEC21 / ATCC MYA-565) TaxID=214684 RepID=Q5K797_CRYD1|nr:hypothetical protein CNN00620 [Cryptococcus neoformans var. neoformans JEC21]XP_771879.1 hypothetical protein CNBN0600 [Cryptococcus neoformans var. neoformans B-3501A]AAW47078.2 hypothetical protein CNN00620 [Cryptococcus neoformans var. neoformans JEC21]EAL17232.1 hypothetical protein CNBN0600 [Cryptococcus neoformans var. neoformans B-3501A]
MTFAKVWPPSFLYKTYIEYAEHKEDNEGGHEAVVEGDSACSDEWKAKNGGAGHYERVPPDESGEDGWRRSTK